MKLFFFCLLKMQLLREKSVNGMLSVTWTFVLYSLLPYGNLRRHWECRPDSHSRQLNDLKIYLHSSKFTTNLWSFFCNEFPSVPRFVCQKCFSKLLFFSSFSASKKFFLVKKAKRGAERHFAWSSRAVKYLLLFSLSLSSFQFSHVKKKES